MDDYLYKVGDKVKIISNPPRRPFEERFPMKSGPWYKDPIGPSMNDSMRKMAGKVVTISSYFNGYYKIKEDNNAYFWTDTMFDRKDNLIQFQSLL